MVGVMTKLPSIEKIVRRLHVKWYGAGWERTEPSGQFDMFDDVVAEILADRNATLRVAAQEALDHREAPAEAILKLREN